MSWLENLNKDRKEMENKAMDLVGKNVCKVEDIESLTEQQKAWLITELINFVKENKR